MKKARDATAIVCIFGFSALLRAQQERPVGPNSPSCVQTAQMRIYSNAFAHEESGDLLGYEFAINEKSDSTADILLYVYEGAPDDGGIPLSGRIVRKKLTAEGKWVEHLVECPSKKENIETHFVKIGGTLDATSFRGQIRIESMESPDKVRLKRVKRLWFCKR